MILRPLRHTQIIDLPSLPDMARVRIFFKVCVVGTRSIEKDMKLMQIRKSRIIRMELNILAREQWSKRTVRGVSKGIPTFIICMYK